MAKGQHLTKHQKGIVNRYYEHRDTIMVTKLAEIVSELYLCADEKKAARLWDRAAAALRATDADPKKSAAVLAARDVEALAQLVGKLTQ